MAEASDSEDEACQSNATVLVKRKKRRFTAISSTGRTVSSSTVYQIRIYRANGSYHVVRINLSVTVEQLAPMLGKRLLLDPEREPHRLYLRERGRGMYR